MITKPIIRARYGLLTMNSRHLKVVQSVRRDPEEERSHRDGVHVSKRERIDPLALPPELNTFAKE